MIMAASNGNNQVGTGGVDAYQYVYEIDISSHASGITYKNHARTMYGCSMDRVSYKVRNRKGHSNKDWFDRYSLKQSLGLTWTDTYPTGYGFSAQFACGSRNWGDGPFFPSIHSGSNRGCSCCQASKVYEGNEKISDPQYAHQGWYGMHNGEYNRRGAMSIWFK
jgi:hypothetical protein